MVGHGTLDFSGGNFPLAKKSEMQKFRFKLGQLAFTYGHCSNDVKKLLKLFLSLTYTKSTSSIDTYVIHPVFLHNINMSLLQALKNTCMQQLIVLWTISLIFAFYELTKKMNCPGNCQLGK